LGHGVAAYEFAGWVRALWANIKAMRFFCWNGEAHLTQRQAAILTLFYSLAESMTQKCMAQKGFFEQWQSK
jgi:hypothetical protein